MRPSQERDFAKEHREFVNLVTAVQAGKDKTGLTFRPLELTDRTRTRGGENSRRRTARVWKPIELEVQETEAEVTNG